MLSPESVPGPVHVPLGGPTAAAADAAAARPGRRSLWVCALSAAVLAGVGSWLAGESVYGKFDRTVDVGDRSEVEMNALKTLRAMTKGRTDTGVATFGMQGAILGLALGAAGGAAARRAGAGLAASAAGLVAGAAAGAGSALGLVPYYLVHKDEHAADLLLPILVHAGLWSAVGLAAGLAFGLGLCDRRRVVPAALGAVLGAVCAALLYQVVGAVAFSTAKTHYPVSEASGSRLMAHLAAAVLVAAGAVVGARNADTNKARG